MGHRRCFQNVIGLFKNIFFAKLNMQDLIWMFFSIYLVSYHNIELRNSQNIGSVPHIAIFDYGTNLNDLCQTRPQYVPVTAGGQEW